ncbi:MAG: polysaccharide biosynthesis/export family protein, partial [Pyrinomonadaceae bacterium]
MKNIFLSLVLFSIFSVGIVSAQSPAVASTQKLPVIGIPFGIEASRGYMFGPGDQISVKVLHEDEYNFTAAVNEDGKIEVPFFETPIVAVCKSEMELRTDIKKLLAVYLVNPQVSLQTIKKSRPRAAIFGEVNLPQALDIERRFTLVEAIALAGGIREEAGGMIEVFRTQAPLCASAEDVNNWRRESDDPMEIPSRVY